MEVSKTEIMSLVSPTGDEYLALLLVPCGPSNHIVLGRGTSEVEAHEQLATELAKLIVAKLEMSGTTGEKAQDESEDEQ
jgi:hypothetical protein